MKKRSKVILGSVFVIVLVFAAVIFLVRYSYRDRMFANHPDLKVPIIVLGTRVEDDGGKNARQKLFKRAVCKKRAILGIVVICRRLF